jgi:hypothetical protein
MTDTTKQTNSTASDLFPVYCANCGKVINQVSLGLLKQTGKVTVNCLECKGAVILEYDAKTGGVEITQV